MATTVLVFVLKLVTVVLDERLELCASNSYDFKFKSCTNIFETEKNHVFMLMIYADLDLAIFLICGTDQQY